MRTLVLAAAAGIVGFGFASTASAEPTKGTSTAESTPSSVQGKSGESLSSKLSKSDGVITPKANVDPGIHAEAPDPHPNSTPVIPPAATGGSTAK